MVEFDEFFVDFNIFMSDYFEIVIIVIDVLDEISFLLWEIFIVVLWSFYE